MYVHPVLCCSFPMYRYLLPTYCGEYRGAFSGSPGDKISHSPLVSVILSAWLSGWLLMPDRARSRSRRSRPPRESPRVRSRKNSHCYVGVWLYYATFSGPKRESARLGAADYKILLYATPKSTIKLISFLTTCIISFSLKARRYLSCRAQVCVCICVRVYELCVFLSSYITVYVYTRLYAIRVLLLLLLFIYTRLSPAPPPVNPQFRFPIYIQYVKIYRLSVI